ncbi:ABC transporter ATP-binding protein [Saccharospirillum mangrovi]|uniref:ABC transporter ATP-binding protein n=1 Tax=Saccharospirillum mangrovi TaxID=2161747 RepID=UPI000D357128|nr:ABC transporter ATP-binding protein [Saccharospirillum mangrovi]
MSNSSKGLAVQNVSVAYGKHQALDNVSIQVEPSEIVVILGANGAGKSSLLGTIAGLVERQSGSVNIGGAPTSGFRAHQVVSAGLALVPEGRGIFGDLSVEENLTLGAHAAHARARENEQRELVYQLFPKLIERRRQIARTMSGGEQQMVAIGRALMSAPDILMLDEPSLGLSPLLASDVFKTLKKVRDTGLGILLVEQNARQSLGIADRGYLLETGRITAEDSAQNLLNDPAVRQAYLGGAANAEAPQVVHQTEHETATEPGEITAPKITQRLGGLDRPVPKSADELAGVNLADWVRNAELKQRETWLSTAPTSSQQSTETQAQTGTALDDMLARFEQAAHQAANESKGHS